MAKDVQTTYGAGTLATLRLLCLLLGCCVAGQLAAMGRQPRERPAPQAVEPEAEVALVNTLLAVTRNQLDLALTEVEKVIHRHPNFRLAHLIKGDLLMAHARPLAAFGNADNAPRERIEALREEAQARLARYQLERPTDRVPKYLLQMHPEQKYALVVDTAQSTLFVFENVDGQARYLADYYVSSGKNGADKFRRGDKKTPLGVYQVVDDLPRAKLADFYGVGAFPINYPNEWDRRQGRNGNGIWLHGVPSDTYSRPPRASDGCVVLTNQDLEKLSKSLQVGVTPVIIAERIEWAKPEAIQATRKDLIMQVEQWRRDWESLDTEVYLRHYAPGFSSGGQNLVQWSQQKRQVNSAKSWIKVKVERVSAFLYPGRDDLAVVTFDQGYSSSNLTNQMRKRQYWLNDKGAWKIVYEGAA